MHSNDIDETMKSDSSTPDFTWRMPFKRIEVGFDLDESANSALSVALLIAKGSDSELFLVNSEPSPPVQAQTMNDYSIRSRQIVMGADSRIRKTLMEHYAFGNVPHFLYVSIDSPSNCLIGAAKQFDSDLIVVGSHGRHGFEQLLFGSVSESLLRHVLCPVLIVGPDCLIPQTPPRTILFSSDLQDSGMRPGEYADSLAKSYDCRLILMHVVSGEPNPDPAMRGWIEDNCRTRLLRLLSPVSRDRNTVETHLSYGDPAQEILAAAHSKQADLLVLGAGKHGPLSDHLPWRTLAMIIRNASCPIFNVRADAK